MGMFDIIDDITLYCPNCGNMIDCDFQTKDFELRCLDHYKPGDLLPKDRLDETTLGIHTICYACDYFMNFKLLIEDNILMNKLI